MKIGIIDAKTENLGDDMQTLAALQYAPDAKFVRRDKIGSERRKLAVIMNAWWMEGSDFPPKDNIVPLPISMHIWNHKMDIEWFRKHQPIGCRDLYTQEYLKLNGIETYFSGCLTLTFPPYEGEREGIIYVDKVPDKWKKTGSDIIYTTHYNKGGDRMSTDKRLKLAEEKLELYRKAKLVITKRLHVALPCLGMGTPVVVNKDVWANERFSGYDLNYDFKGLDYNYSKPRPEELISNLKLKVNDFIKHIR
jgi:hypothetical protein